MRLATSAASLNDLQKQIAGIFFEICLIFVLTSNNDKIFTDLRESFKSAEDQNKAALSSLGKAEIASLEKKVQGTL